MDNNLYAPPTPEEIAKAHQDLYAPPTPEEIEAAKASLPPTQAESLVRGGAVGLTAGFAPNIEAAAKTGMAGLSGEISPQPEQSPLQALLSRFEKETGKAKEANEAAYNQNPLTYGAGAAVGTIAPAMATGGGSAMAQIAKGAALGGAAGLGGSGADLFHPDTEQLTQAAKDTALGGALGGAGSGIASQVSKISPSALLKRLGLEKATGLVGQPLSEAKVGQEVLNQDVLSVAGGARETFKNISSKIEELATKAKDLTSKINPTKELPPIQEDFQLNLAKVINQSEQAGEGRQASRIARDGANYFNEILKPAENDPAKLLEIKRSLGNEVSKGFSKPFSERTYKDDLNIATYNLLNSRIENLAEATNPGLGQEIRSTFKQESSLIKARQGLKKDLEKETKRGVIKKFFGGADERADILAAKGMSGLGNLFEKVPAISPISTELRAAGSQVSVLKPQNKPQSISPMINAQAMRPGEQKPNTYSFAHNSPQQLQAKSQEISQKYGEAGSHLANSLNEASQMDEKERVARLFTLHQNPGFRKMMNEDEPGEER